MGTVPYWPTIPTDPRPAIPIVINVGKVSQVLAMIDTQKNKAFKGGSKVPDNRLWLLLCAISEILEWFYTNLPNHAYTEIIANYLWALITPYQIAGLRALGNGGGIVIDPTTGSSLSLDRYREDFAIGGIGGLPPPRYTLNDGDTSYTVPLSGFIIAFWAPSGVDAFIGNQASMISIDYQPDYVRFNLNQPVVDGENYIVWGLRGGNITSIPTSGTQLPLPYQKGKFLGNDGTNLFWDDTTLQFSATTTGWQADNRTFLNSMLANYQFTRIELVNGPTYFLAENNDFTRIDGGGVTFNDPEFDISQNPAWKFILYKEGF